MNNFNTLSHDIYTMKQSIQILAKNYFDTDNRLKKLEFDINKIDSLVTSTPIEKEPTLSEIQNIINDSIKQIKIETPTQKEPTLSISEIKDIINDSIKQLKIETLVKNIVDKIVEKAVDDKINAVISPKNEDDNEEIIIPDIIPNSATVSSPELNVEEVEVEDDIILGIKEEKKTATTTNTRSRKSNKITK